jgi:RNAse (barnase) inhibitor barstar
LIKELSAQQYQFQGDALYYLLNGRIEMSLKLYLCTLGLSRKKFIDLYSQIIIKNVDQYHKFLSKIFKDPKALVSD